jgi:hypothetical protein
MKKRKEPFPYSILLTPTIGPVVITLYAIFSSAVVFIFLAKFGYLSDLRLPGHSDSPERGDSELGVFIYVAMKFFFVLMVSGPSQFSVKARVWFCIWWDMLVAGFFTVSIWTQDEWLIAFACIAPGIGMIVLCLAAVAVIVIDNMQDFGAKVQAEYKEWRAESLPTETK